MADDLFSDNQQGKSKPIKLKHKINPKSRFNVQDAPQPEKKESEAVLTLESNRVLQRALEEKDYLD